MNKMVKNLKKGQSLTSVTLKSRSRSTILMPALPHALRNIYVKFDRNPPNSLRENGRTKGLSGDGGCGGGCGGDGGP